MSPQRQKTPPVTCTLRSPVYRYPSRRATKLRVSAENSESLWKRERERSVLGPRDPVEKVSPEKARYDCSIMVSLCQPSFFPRNPGVYSRNEDVTGQLTRERPGWPRVLNASVVFEAETTPGLGPSPILSRHSLLLLNIHLSAPISTSSCA